jgi:hypothetical protein
MANIVGTVKFTLNKQWKYSCSSSVTKSANSGVNGRGASIFRIDTDYCINHNSISFS